MTDDLSDIAAQVWGEDDGWMAPGSHGQPADEARRQCALAPRELAANAKCLEALIRADPDNDETFGIFNRSMAHSLKQSDVAYTRFLNVRECSGQG